MAEESNTTPPNIGLPLFDTNGEKENQKKTKVKVGYSGFMSNGFSIKYKIDPQCTKPFELLEELAKLRDDESLTKEEKNLRIKKMLDME